MAGQLLTNLGGVVDSKVAVVPQTIASATTTAGVAIDCNPSGVNYDDTVELCIATGDNGDSTLTTTVKLQECDTSGGTYVDMSPVCEIVVPAGATAGDTYSALATGRRSKRYLKASVVTAGAGTLSCKIAATVLLRRKISGSGKGTRTTETA